jgi:hypothetical protein
MAITNIDPNNFDETFDAYYKSLPTGSIPGMTVPAINFKDAPVNFIMRQNNPALPFYKEPATNIKNIVQNFPGSVKSGIGKGFDLGKAAIGGIASLVTGIPGIGALLGAFGPMSPEDKAMRDFYGSEFGLTDTGQVASGIMQGYNPVSLFGSTGLNQAIDKRIARIQKTLQKKKSDTLQQRLKDLQALKAKEAAASAKALEAQRIGRRPSAPSGDGGTKDSGGPTGGYSYDSGGRQGFGYGLKNGGLVSLL